MKKVHSYNQKTKYLSVIAILVMILPIVNLNFVSLIYDPIYRVWTGEYWEVYDDPYGLHWAESGPVVCDYSNLMFIYYDVDGNIAAGQTVFTNSGITRSWQNVLIQTTSVGLAVQNDTRPAKLYIVTDIDYDIFTDMSPDMFRLTMKFTNEVYAEISLVVFAESGMGWNPEKIPGIETGTIGTTQTVLEYSVDTLSVLSQLAASEHSVIGFRIETFGSTGEAMSDGETFSWLLDAYGPQIETGNVQWNKCDAYGMTWIIIGIILIVVAITSSPIVNMRKGK